jgi:hypothetical protein
MIEFDIRPRDGRMMEVWQHSKYPLSMPQQRFLYFGTLAAALTYAYRHPERHFLLVLFVFVVASSRRYSGCAFSSTGGTGAPLPLSRDITASTSQRLESTMWARSALTVIRGVSSWG